MGPKIQNKFFSILRQFEIRVFAISGLQKSKKWILLRADECMAKTNSVIRLYEKKYMKNDCIQFFSVSRAGSTKFLSYGQKLWYKVVKKRLKTISRAMYSA